MTTTTKAPGVEVAHLRASYDRRVLTDVSFTAAAGSTTVIMGSPGSGKTTLVRILLGRLGPDSGEVTVGGRAVSGAGSDDVADIHRRTAFLFSGLNSGATGRKGSALGTGDPDDGVDEGADVGTNVRRAVGPAGEDGQADRILATFDLSDHAHRSARELDPGTRRRLALARVFAGGASLIVLDDPVATLAPDDRDAVIAALRRARSETDATIVLTCYDVTTTKAVGDHLVALVAGRVRKEGPVARHLHLITSNREYAAQYAMRGSDVAASSTASLAEHRKLLGFAGYDQRALLITISVIGLVCLVAILLFMVPALFGVLG